MPPVNSKYIKQLLGNPSLLYAMLKNNSEIALPLEMTDHGNLAVTLYGPNGDPWETISLGDSDSKIGAVKFVNELGNPYGIKHIDNKPRVSSMPYGYDIVEGNVPNHSLWRMTGAVTDIDNAYETVWSVGGIYVFPTVGMQMEALSTSNEDASGEGANPAGTGIRYLHIHYLDNNWNEQTETLALDGTNVVTTTATNIYRNNVMHAAKTPIGATKAAVGTINLRHLANTPIYAQIVAGQTQALQAVYTVPLGKTVYIVTFLVGSGSDGGGHYVKTYFQFTRDENGWTNGVWYIGGLIPTQDGAVSLELPMPGKMPEKVDIRVQTVSDNVAANAEVAVEFIGWIEDN